MLDLPRPVDPASQPTELACFWGRRNLPTMESFFSRYKNPLVLVLLLLGQFVLLAVQVRPQLPGAAVADHAGVRAVRLGVASVVAPPEKVVHAGGLGLRDLWSSYLDLVDVKQQNEALAARNQQLQLEESALAEDARQGERLQELLAFKQHYVDSTVPAQVIGTGGSDHGRTLIIDKGAEDGIAVDMPVITPDGIVGKIREVNPHSSEVLEISDPNSAAGVLLEETRTRGILSGDGSGRPEIVNLMPDDRIQKGQLVLTSGGDQIFPRGLPVGVVEKVVPDYLNQPLVDVILKPAANLSRLEEVLVVTATSSTLTPKMKHDLAQCAGSRDGRGSARGPARVGHPGTETAKRQCSSRSGCA
jgi:rod shape-determining protein MreC